MISSDFFGIFLITSGRDMATGGAEVQRMVRGWRGGSRGGVWRQAVQGLCVQAVLGAPTAMQPTDSDSGGEVGCALPLVDVVWGFLLTLLALSIAFWSSWQVLSARRSVSSSEGLKHGSRQVEESWIWTNLDVEDDSEAMVIGEDGPNRTRSMNYEKKQLSVDGKLTLFWGEYFSSERDQNSLLPKYNELKYLRGNSGFAVIAIAIQAIGYIYAVTFRNVKDLKVAPTEVIGLVFNILLLIGASLYSTSNVCVRPLIIYMDDEREEKFARILKLRRRLDFDMKIDLARRFTITSLGIIVLFICSPTLIYFIISLKKFTNMMVVVPFVIFGVGLLLSLQGFYFVDRNETLEDIILYLTIPVNMVAYVWAMVVTFRHWKSHHFNTRPELLDWSQVIPFIG